MSGKPARTLMMSVVVSFMLVACSSGVKDYSKATELTDIDEQLLVKPLWINHTAYLPRYTHRQLTPVVDGDTLYFANVKGVLDAVKTDTGSSIWNHPVNEILSGGPGIGGGLVIVGTRKAEVLALSAVTGKEVWRTRISTEMLAQPVVVGDHIIVQAGDGKISALETQTGKLAWNYSHEIPNLTLRGTSAPLVVGDQVLAGFADGKLVSLNIDTGELQWETVLSVSRGRTDLERLVDIDGLFAARDDVVYVSSFQGKLAALSVGNGSILWSRDISSFTGLSLSGSKVLVTDTESRVWALDQATGETLWRQDNLIAREITAPMVIDDAVVVADFDGYIHWLSLDNGGFIARQNLDDIWSRSTLILADDPQLRKDRRTVSAPPVVAGNRVFVRDNVGALAALQVRGPVTKP